ncbi:hypothetical protein STEG23_028745 [Scotinomys teguina]
MPFNRRMDKENVYTMEYYAAEKNNDIMKSAGKWMELENVILSKHTQHVSYAQASSTPQLLLSLWSSHSPGISNMPVPPLYLGFTFTNSLSWAPFSPQVWNDDEEPLRKEKRQHKSARVQSYPPMLRSESHQQDPQTDEERAKVPDLSQGAQATGSSEFIIMFSVVP